LEHINEYLATYGYIFLFFYSLGGGFFAMIGATILAYTGKMDIWAILFIATLSNFIGDALLFYMGRFNKKELLSYLKKHKRKVAYSHHLLRKYGTFTIFAQKFLYGIKTLIPMVMGFSKYNFTLFLFYNVFASFIFSSFVIALSYYFSAPILDFIKQIEDYAWAYPLILIAIIFGIWKLLDKITAKK